MMLQLSGCSALRLSELVVGTIGWDSRAGTSENCHEDEDKNEDEHENETEDGKVMMVVMMLRMRMSMTM